MTIEKPLKILVAPLNWGLGHATRMIPIVEYLQADKQHHEVVIAGDGASFLLLRKRFPQLRYVQLPSLEISYSAGNSQVGAMLKALPKIVQWSLNDHQMLKHILATEHFDVVISDNRFGFFSKQVRSVYVTHQLMIKMPSKLKWLENIAHKLHLCVINKYDECLVPDNEGADNLSGDLSHLYPLPRNARFIGRLSRFANISNLESAVADAQNGGAEPFHLAVLSGVEPHRTLLEQQLIDEYNSNGKQLYLVQGKPNKPWCELHHNNITIAPYLNDEKLSRKMLAAEQIIVRSGYSTIMDLDCLGVLNKTVFYPTPGQTEQEYLALFLSNKAAHSNKSEQRIEQ